MRENKQYLSSWGWVTSFNISSSICFLESCILVFSLQKNKTVYMCYVFISLSLESRLILFPYCCAQSSNKHRQASIFVVGYIVLWVYSPAMVWLDHMQDLLLLAFWETSTLLHMLIIFYQHWMGSTSLHVSRIRYHLFSWWNPFWEGWDRNLKDIKYSKNI